MADVPFLVGSRNLSVLEVKIVLRPTVCWPVCLGVKHPYGAQEQVFTTIRQLRVCCCWTGLSFTIAADPRQRSHSQVRVPRVS
jgi:hypothetical protein